MKKSSSSISIRSQKHLELDCQESLNNSKIQKKKKLAPLDLTSNQSNSNLSSIKLKTSRNNSKINIDAINKTDENKKFEMIQNDSKVDISKKYLKTEEENSGLNFFNKNIRSKENKGNDFFSKVGKKTKENKITKIFEIKNLEGNSKEDLKNFNSSLENTKKENYNKTKNKSGKYKLKVDSEIKENKAHNNKNKNYEIQENKNLESIKKEKTFLDNSFKDDVNNDDIHFTNIKLNTVKEKSDKYKIKETKVSKDINEIKDNESNTNKKLEKKEEEIYLNEGLKTNDINHESKTQQKNPENSLNKKNSDDEPKKITYNNLNCIERQKNNVFYNMYISNVYNRLREIDNCSDVDAQRWPYELLQNAKDSISGDKTRDSVNVEFNIQNDFVIIRHDGSPFNTKQFYALLYKYSEGKDKKNNESTGRFGTGFLTTHLLSKTVKIEGPLYDENEENEITGIIGFSVTMYREGITKGDLLKGLQRTEKEKEFFPNEHPKWTKYTYILKSERNHSSSILGYNNIKINVFLTMVFNKIFNSIIIQYQKEKYKYTNQSITDKDLGDNIKIFDFEFYDEINKKPLQKKYLYTKYKKFSQVLSTRFATKRDLTIEACIEVDSDKNILIDERSPCLFCSLPLVGSECHVLPLILNSNDFEPSTERQEILLNGEDENEFTKIPTDVGVNKSILITSMELYKNIVEFASKNKYKNLHYLVRGINEIPKQKKYFDKKWYKEKFIIPMREIIYKIPVIYIDDDKLDYIKNIYFPIYDDIDNEKFYYLCKKLYENVPEYKTSLQWSKYIWDEDMEGNKITVEKLVDKFSTKKYSEEFTNELIKFIWDNYKEIPPKKPLLINQKKEYIKYNENNFYQDVDVHSGIIYCLEELGYDWKKCHLHKCITSIELPAKHSMKEAINLIKDKIKEDEKKSFILCKYINKNDEHRKNVYYFTKKFLDKNIGKESFVFNFSREIYTECDKYLIENIAKYIEARGTFDNLNIPFSEYETLLQFLYNYYGGEDIFNRKKLLLSETGKFEFLHCLKKNVNIPSEIIKKAKDYLKLDLNRILISGKINKIKFNIKNYSMDDFMLEINPKLVLEQTNQKDKENMAKALLQYIPNVHSEKNPLAEKQLKMQKKVRYIYEIFTGYRIEEKPIETHYEFFWTNSNKIIIDLCQKTAENKQNLNNYSKNSINYIKILNEYGDMFELEKYAIVPSVSGIFKKASELKNFNDIDDDLVNGLIANFDYSIINTNILHKSVKLDIVKKETIFEFGNLVYEKMQKGNQKNNLEMSKILIKFIPKKTEYSDEQKKLYNMYTYFEKLGEIKRIEKCKLLYDTLKPVIVKDILERIDKSQNIETINKIVKDYIAFINTNHNILEKNKNVYDEYKIIPNQNGFFNYGKDLIKDNKLSPELRDLINEYRNKDKKFALKDVLMHNSIKCFNPAKHKNNNELIPLVDDLLAKKYLDPVKILEFYPADEKSKETQRKLRFIYENLYNKKLKKIIIDLPLLWKSANELIIDAYLARIQKQQLKLLNKDENIALKILEIFYEFKNPELDKYSDLQIVPNYYGELKAYKELREENNLSENFIEMMKKYFDHDIRKYSKHKKIKFKLKQKFEFNKEICKIINDKLTGFSSHKILIAKEFIKFYPSYNGEKILKFINCYKTLTKNNFEEDSLETNNVLLWDNAIILLLKDLINDLKNDKNLDNLCKRTGQKEAVIIGTLNEYYRFCYYYARDNKNKIKKTDLWLPNCYGEFRKYEDLSSNKGITDQLKKIMKLLDEKKDYNKILLHEKIKLDDYRESKEVKDILKEIDDAVQDCYYRYDSLKNDDKKKDKKNDNNKINDNLESKEYENFKEACSLLLKKWGPNHQDEYKEKLTFVYSHKMEIIMHVILDEDVQQRFEEGLNKDPEELINYMNGFSLKKQFMMEDNHNHNYNYNDQVKQLDLLYGGRRVNVNEYIDQIPEDNNSTNVDLDYYANEFLRNNNISDDVMELFNNLMGNNIKNNDNIEDNENYINTNNNCINDNKNIKLNNDPVHNFVRAVRINRVIVNNINDHTANNYYIAQAYVYEYFQKFDNLAVTWENLIRNNNNNVEGAITVKIPSNNHVYKIIDKKLGHDLIIETLNKKKFKVKVRYSLGTDDFYNFLVQYRTWNLLNNNNEFLLTFVSLKDIKDPQIIICSRVDLNDLIKYNR